MKFKLRHAEYEAILWPKECRVENPPEWWVQAVAADPGTRNSLFRWGVTLHVHGPRSLGPGEMNDVNVARPGDYVLRHVDTGDLMAVTALELKRFFRPSDKCPECGGEGALDSGGTEPWGAPINVPCPFCGPSPSALVSKSRLLLLLEFAEKLADLQPSPLAAEKMRAVVQRVKEEVDAC